MIDDAVFYEFKGAVETALVSQNNKMDVMGRNLDEKISALRGDLGNLQAQHSRNPSRVHPAYWGGGTGAFIWALLEAAKNIWPQIFH